MLKKNYQNFFFIYQDELDKVRISKKTLDFLRGPTAKFKPQRDRNLVEK